VGDTLYLVNRTSDVDELWATDGTAEHTGRVATLGDASPMFAGVQSAGLDDRLLFSGFDSAHGQELWSSGGTPETTRRVSDVCAGPCSSKPASFRRWGRRVAFAATTDGTGRELWISDGTTDGTALVADVAPGPRSSSPRPLAVVAEKLVFVATGPRGPGLWVTGGTADTTHRVSGLPIHDGWGATVHRTKRIGDRLFLDVRIEHRDDTYEHRLYAVGPVRTGEPVEPVHSR